MKRVRQHDAVTAHALTDPQTLGSQRYQKPIVTANVLPSSMILFTLMTEAIRSSKMSVLTRATRRHIPEDGILHSHNHENLKSSIALTGWTL
jgi:hypothetical protein